MTQPIGRTAVFLLTLLLAPAAWPALATAEPGGGDERELVVYFPPGALEARVGERPAVLQLLEAAHPELRAGRVDESGMSRYLVAPTDLPRVAAVRRTVARLGGVLGKVMPSPARQALDRIQLQASRMGKPDVLGLLVRYRDPAKRTLAAKNVRLGQSEIARIATITGMEVATHRPMSGGMYAANFRAPTDLLGGELAAKRLAMDPEVEAVDLNVRHEIQRVPNDEFFNLQWNLRDSGPGIRAISAWDVTTGSANIVVGVVDTGYVPHPDLVGRVLQGADTITDPARSRDGNARDGEATDRGDFNAAGECGAGSEAMDSSWHGTHVMGIIGANGNNGIGIAGVDWNARLVPVRALGRCGGDTADIVDGIRWAAGLDVPGLSRNPNPARVINMSLRGPGSCTFAYNVAIADVMATRGIVIVAAGNDNASGLDFVPASCAMTLTVTAVGPNGDKAPYSNYGVGLEMSAPGGDVSVRDADGIPSLLWSGTQGTPGDAIYVYYQGTSQATPHVSGVASLMLSVNPNLSVAQIRDILQGTVTPFPAGSRCARQGDCGAGIVNAATAVATARQFGGRYNYTDTYYNAAEPGWGITMQHEGDTIFGAWYNYAPSGRPLWYFMSALKQQNDDVFIGDIYVPTSGTPFNRMNGTPSLAGFTRVGAVAISFLENDHAFMIYNFNGAQGAKHIFRFPFGPATTCTFGTASRAGTANFQDLWWNEPERGWGLNLSHQGSQIFAAWFTYGTDGAPLWLVGQLQRTTGNTYTGPVFQTTGVPAETVFGQQASRSISEVGTMTIAFSDGEHGTFTWNIGGQAGSRPITRQVFASPVPQCR